MANRELWPTIFMVVCGFLWQWRNWETFEEGFVRVTDLIILVELLQDGCTIKTFGCGQCGGIGVILVS